jgi:diadenosine tetraphosphate (Ap4A) HIT family hydrolase
VESEVACIFCDITDREIEIRNELAYATRDTYPVAKGHMLIVPRRHVPSWFETTAEERLDLLGTLDEAQRLLNAEYGPAAYNIGINDGPAAGQSIPHLHILLIPRSRGDCADPRGGVRWIFPEKAVYWAKR